MFVCALRSIGAGRRQAAVRLPTFRMRPRSYVRYLVQTPTAGQMHHQRCAKPIFSATGQCKHSAQIIVCKVVIPEQVTRVGS